MERFWTKVVKTESCWLWTAYTMPNGYGMFQFEGRAHLAHRVAYGLLVGPIPPGLTIDHLCRVRKCVNPAHLEPVTVRENSLRGNTVIARNTAKTHCPRGHELVGSNLIPSHLRRGWRACLTCHKTRMHARNRHVPQDAKLTRPRG